jgi:hypothetical protein
MDASFQHAIETASAAFAGGKSARAERRGSRCQILATMMPAGMLFVPSIGGISHHWTEKQLTPTSSPAPRCSSMLAAVFLRDETAMAFSRKLAGLDPGWIPVRVKKARQNRSRASVLIQSEPIMP